MAFRPPHCDCSPGVQPLRPPDSFLPSSAADAVIVDRREQQEVRMVADRAALADRVIPREVWLLG
jgi:hypothetical protein